eukprot:TRINITY_DN45133_c0_g1_i1.p1 TRINITY_DN45133_c0_g1~~TRINITY_DN45133_c0_g1_i1.p1  ORF type:complete len:151 (-),score=17.75 TRINITY_DN45133_c0_g1_i1:336-788(-)
MPTSPAKTTSSSPSKSASSPAAVVDAFKQQGVPTVKLTTSKAFNASSGGIHLGGSTTTTTATPPGTSPIFQDLSQTQDSIMGFDPFLTTQQQQQTTGVGAGGANDDSSSAPPSESFAEALRRRYQQDEDDDDDVPVVPAVTHFSMSMSAE